MSASNNGNINKPNGDAKTPVLDTELQAHNTDKDCWLAIHGHVYDMTGFLDKHPGGKAILMKYAGKDATESFSVLIIYCEIQLNIIDTRVLRIVNASSGSCSIKKIVF